MKLFTQIPISLTRTAQADEQQDIQPDAPGESGAPKPFEMRISSRWNSVDNMLSALNKAGIDYEERHAARWNQGIYHGTVLDMATAKDVENAATLLNDSPHYADVWSPVIGGNSPAIQKYIHRELDEKILEKRRDELYYEMHERADEHKRDILRTYLETGKIPWPKLPQDRIVKIWADYNKYGFVRDTEGMEQIASVTVDIVERMMASNNLSGRDTTWDFRNLMEDEFGYTLSEDDDSVWIAPDGRRVDMDDFFFNDNLHSSDYSMGDLVAAAMLLKNADTPEEQLTYVDRILNTVHQSSDLCRAFVPDGQKFLNRLYGAGKE